MAKGVAKRVGATRLDEERMRELYSFTARTLETSSPVPFGALIVDSVSGERLIRATNAVIPRIRSQCARGVANCPTGMQEAEESAAGGIHDVFHV